MVTHGPRLVAVEWVDAVGPCDLEAGQKLRPYVAYTVGWVYEDADEYLTVAGEIFKDDEDTWRACTTIPKACITEVTDLLPRYRKVVEAISELQGG